MTRPFRIVLVLVVLLLAAAGGYSALWFYAADQVQSGLARWRTARSAEGYTIAYEASDISGFPLAMRFRVERALLALPKQGWRWAGEAIEATVQPWAPRTIRLHPSGRQEISYPTALGVRTLIVADADSKAVVEFGADGYLRHGSFDADRLVVTSGIGAAGAPPAANLEPVAVQGIHMELTNYIGDTPASTGPNLPPSAAFVLGIDDLTLPGAANSPLGAHLSHLALDAELTGTVPAADPRTALAAWRDAGGTLELKNFDLAWGPLRLSGNATVALDAALQPEGAATANVRGFNEAIEALIARGQVGPREGKFAEAALGLLAKPAPDGGPAVLTVPLSIQQHRLYAGPFGLMELPAIAWPE